MEFVRREPWWLLICIASLVLFFLAWCPQARAQATWPDDRVTMGTCQGETTLRDCFDNVIEPGLGAPGGGEANTAAQIPTASGEDITGPKVGPELQFKGIVGGTALTASSDPDDITLELDAGIVAAPIWSSAPIAALPNAAVVNDEASLESEVGVAICTANDSAGSGGCPASGGGSKHIIEDEANGVLADQPTLYFSGPGIACTDDPANSRTDCNVTTGGGGEQNTLSLDPAATGASPVATTPKVGADLRVRGITGDGGVISTAVVGEDVQVSSTAEANTAAKTPAATGSDITNGKVGAELRFKGIVGASGIVVSEGVDDVGVLLDQDIQGANYWLNVVPGALPPELPNAISVIDESGLETAVSVAICTANDSAGTGGCPAGGGGSKHVIQDEGTPLTERTNLNFTGSGITCTDGGAGPDSTICDVPAAAPGSGINGSSVGLQVGDPATESFHMWWGAALVSGSPTSTQIKQVRCGCSGTGSIDVQLQIEGADVLGAPITCSATRQTVPAPGGAASTISSEEEVTADFSNPIGTTGVCDVWFQWSTDVT